MLTAVCNNCEAGTSPEFSPKIKKGFCTWNNQLLIIVAYISARMLCETWTVTINIKKTSLAYP